MSKLTAREVRKYLETKSQADLVNDIVVFFNRFDGVKEFYSAQMGRGFSEELLENIRRLSATNSFPRVDTVMRASQLPARP